MNMPLPDPHMNRAQRRAAKKGIKPRRVLNKKVVCMAFDTLIQKHSTEEQDGTAELVLLTPAYGALECLLKGTMNGQQLVTLLEVVNYAYLLAMRLTKFAANQDTAELLAECEQPLYEAAVLLGEIGERKRDEGKFRAGQKEVDKLREALRLAGELTAVADRGHTLTALCEAVENVKDVIERPELYDSLFAAAKNT